MTSIIEKLTNEIRQARLDGDQNRLDILVVLKSDIMHGLSQKQPVKPQKTIARLITSYQEIKALLRDFKAIAVYQQKIDLLESFLETGKTQLDTNALQQLLVQHNFTSIRDWMVFLKENYEDQYDAKLASTLYNNR